MKKELQKHTGQGQISTKRLLTAADNKLKKGLIKFFNTWRITFNEMINL